MKPLRCLVAVLLLVLLLPACSRVSRANYERIETGMSYDEVVAILGEPTESKSAGLGGLSGTTARWEGPEGLISIQFLNDEVKIKRFRDNEAGD